MQESQLRALLRIFFKKQNCGELNLEGCAEMRDKYKKSLRTKGCTSCKKRRMRIKFADKFRKLVKASGKTFEEIKGL
jgi:hypothetical protein